MSLVQRTILSLAKTWGTVSEAWRLGTDAPQGRVYVPSGMLDGVRASLSENLNFTRLRSLLSGADAGDLASGLGLFEEMVEKDIHLAGVVDTRIRALTGLDYQITSAGKDLSDEGQRRMADAAAAYCDDVLSRTQSFPDVLEHLANAMVSNVAVAELVWDENRLADVVSIPSWRLKMDPFREPGVMRVITQGHPDGEAVRPGKFVVFVPRSPVEFPFRRSALRAQSFVYLVKMLAVVDWAAFCELFGMPLRWATYRSTATKEDKDSLLEMLRTIGSKGYGAFSEAVSFELKESTQRGTQPYEALIAWCDRKQSILFLGGNLAADTTGGTGTFSAAKVQDEVRQDLRDDDIRREARMIRENILRTMVHYRWPDHDVPVPHFERTKPETIDRQLEANVIRTAQSAGIRVPKAWAHERLGIPEPKDDEEALSPSLDAFGQGMVEGGIGNAE